MKHSEHLLSKMKQKGWSDQELAHARSVFAQKYSTPWFVLLLHWMFLCLVIIGNVIIATSIIPLLILFPLQLTYLLTAVLGGCFGYLIVVVVKHIDHFLDIHHHLFLALIIPLLSIAGFITITYYMAFLFDVTLVGMYHIYLIASMYVMSFLTPYIVHKWLHPVV
ncbi:MAG: hypothetical protein ACMXYC_02050 [Candidatus Woesearchaeota archaeon]